MSASRFNQYWQRIRPHLMNGQELRAFVIIFGCTVAFTDNVLGFTICVGPSMIPTIDPEGELTLIDRFSYKIARKDYRTDDVVISLAMDNPKKSKWWE